MKVFVALALVALVGASLIEGRAIRDLKSNLITRGNVLLKQAEEAVTKLEAEKKTHEATVIKTEEAKIKKTIADLEAATDNTKVIHLERELVLAEVRLHLEILKAGHSHVAHPTHVPAKRDLKADLTTRGNELLKKATEAMTKLEAEPHKAHDVTVIKTEATKIQNLLKTLEATTAAHELKHVEHQLLVAEAKLAHELLKIEQHHAHTHHTHVTHPHTTHAHVSHPHTTHAPHAPTTAAPAHPTTAAPVHPTTAAPAHPTTVAPAHPTTKAHANRDVKSDLIAKSTELLTKADAAIKALQADHKTHQAATLKAEESRIKHLVAELQAATDDAKIKHIEHELARAEVRLAYQVEAHGHHHAGTTKAPAAKRDVKADLIAKSTELLTKADAAIKTLTADHKTHQAATLKAEEARIKHLVADLQAATDDSKIKHIEHELARAETRLAHHLEAHGEHHHGHSTTVASF